MLLFQTRKVHVTGIPKTTGHCKNTNDSSSSISASWGKNYTISMDFKFNKERWFLSEIDVDFYEGLGNTICVVKFPNFFLLPVDIKWSLIGDRILIFVFHQINIGIGRKERIISLWKKIEFPIFGVDPHKKIWTRLFQPIPKFIWSTKI